MYELPKEFKVDCTTHEAFEEALKLLDEAGFTWANGAKPSVRYASDNAVFIYVCGSRIRYGVSRSFFHDYCSEEVSFIDFMLALSSKCNVGQFSEDSFMSMLEVSGSV